MRESEFQKQVIQLAHMYGWRVAHFGNTVKVVAQKSGGYRTVGDAGAKGFPDLVLVRKQRLVFAELKTRVGKTTPEQDAWLTDLRQVECEDKLGPEVYLWRPHDLSLVAEILR